jgi:O-antigen ligase
VGDEVGQGALTQVASRPPESTVSPERATLHLADLDPAQVAKGVYTTRRRFTRVDVAVAIGFMLCLLYMIPAREIVPGLTGNGRPATLIAMLLFAWWLLVRLNPRYTWVGPQPLRWAMWLYIVSLLLSYLAGLQRGLTTLESSGQDLAVISTLQFVGVVLATADGLPNWDRLRTVLRVLVWCGGFMAVVGVLQFLLDDDVNRFLVLPGLQLHGDLIGLEGRGDGFFRVNGTAFHYIEFSACLATVLPFAIHFARYSGSRKQRQNYIILALLIAAGIPIALSRTGIVALAVAMLVMIPAWGRRMSVNVGGLGAMLIAVFIVGKPGELGTLQSLFYVDANDPSIAGRLEDYATVSLWYGQRPWLGRGPGTLIPQAYHGLILDNEWLYTIVTGGIIGVAALALLHVMCLVLAFVALRRSKTPEDRQLCAALMAAVLISVVIAGTFDSLGFSTYAFTIAILMGMCGTVWRFTHPARSVRTTSTSWRTAS